MFSTKEIAKGNQDQDFSYIDVHMKLANIMREVANSVALCINYTYVFDNELHYNQTSVSNDVWEIMSVLGYEVETFDNGDGVSGRGIKVSW